MKCSGWRLGISSVIWPSVRSKRHRPQSGTDCNSRKCVLPSGVVRRYTICKIRGREEPRLRVYDDARKIASMTVPSWDWGRAHVDKLISGKGFSGLGRSFSPARMRCGTFARTHGREAEMYAASGNTHLNRNCDTVQAKAMLDGATLHRKWMLAKARECVAAGKKVDHAEVNRLNRELTRKIKALQSRLRRPCKSREPPLPPPIQTRWHRAQRG